MNKCSAINEVDKLVLKYLNTLDNNLKENIKEILKIKSKNVNESIDIEEFLSHTQNLHELNKNRKELGIYYTPKDLAIFMARKVLSDTLVEDNKVLNFLETRDKEKLLDKTIFDPTCGNAEFLLICLQEKIKYLNLYENIGYETAVKLANSVSGNDINNIAVYISKVRIYLYLFDNLVESNRNLEFDELKKLYEIIERNFTVMDFLSKSVTNKKFDCVIGNPPYVEQRFYKGNLKERYGNLYANTLDKSLNYLKESGKIAFVIPISYISTPRMRKIREVVESKADEQVIISFGDRPDALFQSAHQKLSILFATKSKQENTNCMYWTSDYLNWYKKERVKLFEDIHVFNAKQESNEFVAKINSDLEESIYTKITYDSRNNPRTLFNYNEENISLFDYINSIESTDGIYLNMRATFWIKAFFEEQKSREYKKIKCKEEDKYYLYCLLNSSLFFWYWNKVSDCWHITNKEFKNLKFKFNNSIDFSNVANNLMSDLEYKKEYVGTKQTDYIYLHRLSKDGYIDAIDNKLSKIYGLTETELAYIKNYKYKYRMSLGE